MLIPSVAVLIIKEGQVLLVKHGPKANMPNDKVGLPSGHVEEGETEIQAAARELKEETGLVASEKDLTEFPNNYYKARIPLKDGSNHEYGWRVYLCNSYSGEIRGNDETTPVWADMNQLDNLTLLPNVKDAVKAGLKFLQSGYK